MNTGLEDIQDGESSGMVVAVRIKPCDDSTTNFSIHSPGNNLLQVVTATRDDNSNIYQYDHVYWSTGTEYDQPYYASQEIIYTDIGSSLVQNTLKGFNCSLFAYGQTGSGKTYTMFGQENDEGIIPRVCRNLMTNPPEEEHHQLSFKVTYIEIFLEKVRDLLATSSSSTSNNLRVREHPTDGPFVDGALCLEVHNLEDCMKYIQIGNKNRMIASTKLNLESSRSHAIFTIHCTQTRVLDTSHLDSSHQTSPLNGLLMKEDGKSYTILSKLNLIDLAGSENSLAAGTEGERLKEGAAINKSLLTLGRVIKILAENSQKEKKITSQNLTSREGRRRHSMLERSTSERNVIGTPTSESMRTSDKRSSLSPQSSSGTLTSRSRGSTLTLVPYRDSVLTYLLKESLGGNSKTTMIATIRPGMNFSDESANTLRYAAQAKKIVNIVVVNENPYIKMIKKLQKEVEELTKRLASNPQPLSPSQTPETFTIASLPHQESPPHISPQLVDIPKETSTESTTPERSDLPTQSIASAPILTSTLSTPLSTQPSPSQTPPHLFTPQTATQRSLSPSSISSEPNYTKYSVPSTPQRDAQFPRSHSRSSASLILSDQPSPLRRSVSQRSYHNQLQRDYQSSQVHQLDQYLPPRASRSSYLGSQSSSPPLLSPQNLHSLSPHSPHLSPYSLYPANMSHQDDDASTVTDAATECGDPHDLDVPDSDEVLILKEGYLMKKGFINPAFKRRWCVLRGRQILFYKRFTDKNIRGIINIQGATTHPADDKRNSLPFGFYLHTPQDKAHSKWLLQAASEEEMLSWINAIQVASVHFDQGPHMEEKEVSSCLLS